MFRHRTFIGWLAASLGVVTATLAFAHPTDSELREAHEDRQRCKASVAPAELVDPVQLGISEAALRAAVTGLRQDPLPSRAESQVEQNLTRFVRDAKAGLASVDYELWQGNVYRIRWRLAAHFERPVLDELSRRASVCFGPPEYDQKFEAEPGSPLATLRRIGWVHGGRRIELRQLHPLRGGPVYLSVSESATLREIGAARVADFPPPDRSGPWWQRSMKVLVPATDAEQKRLGDEFLGLISQLDH